MNVSPLRIYTCLFAVLCLGSATSLFGDVKHSTVDRTYLTRVGTEKVTLRSASASIAKADRKPRLLVITVPDRKHNVERMQRLGHSLDTMGFKYDIVHGPNMDKYCPSNVSDYEQSKAAGKQLLRTEWHGRIPNMSTYDLALFQMACLTAHLRAWQHIVDMKTPMVILEDDVELDSAENLTSTVDTAMAHCDGDQPPDVILLDARHCEGDQPPHLPREASGIAGYWLNVKAAAALLAKFPLDIPADWGVNQIFNEDLQTVCPIDFPVHEFGGDEAARLHSAAHGCQDHLGSMKDAKPLLLSDVSLEEDDGSADDGNSEMEDAGSEQEVGSSDLEDVREQTTDEEDEGELTANGRLQQDDGNADEGDRGSQHVDGSEQHVGEADTSSQQEDGMSHVSSKQEDGSSDESVDEEDGGSGSSVEDSGNEDLTQYNDEDVSLDEESN